VTPILPLLLAAALPGDPIPHAGDDLYVDFGAELRLTGSIEGHAPLDFWMADGNDQAENKLMRYHSLEGLSAIGPLRRLNGVTMGWPGDLLRIDGRIYGIDVGARLVYILDEDTGICLPVTRELPPQWRALHSLAHDPETGYLYAVDLNTGQLLRIERGSGTVKLLNAPELRGKKGVRSLAFEPELRLLFAADDHSSTLLVIEPDSGSTADTMILPRVPGRRIEELQFFEGELYAMVGLLEGGDLVGAQLQRINLRTGFVADVSPLLRGLSPHALLINSVPEDFHWAQVGGPAVAELEYTRKLDTAVTVPEPGRYEFELRVAGATDRVVIEVVAAERDAQGISDECETDGGRVGLVEPVQGALRVTFLLDPAASQYSAPTGLVLAAPHSAARTPFVVRCGFDAALHDPAGAAALRGDTAHERLDRWFLGRVHDVVLWRRGAPGPCAPDEPEPGQRVASSS
jgi:hypothetical protein